MERRYDRPTILTCPPDYYGIEYEINPWMSRSRQSDFEESRQQWRALVDQLRALGVDVLQMKAVEGLPDLVFTANAGMIWGRRVFLSRFRHAARQGETEHDAAWFRENDFETIELPETMYFEGAGDALFCGETLFAGYVTRSDARAEQWVASRMNCRVIPLELIDTSYYHLDTCFCPLTPTAAIWYPPAFDAYGQKAITEFIPNLIAVEPEEAARFACNAVVVGHDVVLNTGCPKLGRALQEQGFRPHPTELGEFIKAGGSAKCLTLRLDGEEAAVWP